MSQRRPIHDRLFRAIVVMGASLGASACGNSAPPKPDATPSDARLADASATDALTDANEVDAVIIL